eukprot:scaffold16358_cov54-Attheya_sp.AAC.2
MSPWSHITLVAQYLASTTRGDFGARCFFMLSSDMLYLSQGIHFVLDQIYRIENELKDQKLACWATGCPRYA